MISPKGQTEVFFSSARVVWETQISHDILWFYPRDIFRSVRLKQVGMFLQGYVYTVRCAYIWNRRLVVFFRIFFLMILEIGTESFGVVLWQSHMGECIAPFSVFPDWFTHSWLTQDSDLKERSKDRAAGSHFGKTAILSLCQDSQMNSVTVWILCADGKLGVKPASFCHHLLPPVLEFWYFINPRRVSNPGAFSLPTSSVSLSSTLGSVVHHDSHALIPSYRCCTHLKNLNLVKSISLPTVHQHPSNWFWVDSHADWLHLKFIQSSRALSAA